MLQRLESSMDEHDDDLESTVHEGAEEETEEFPNTSDELDETSGEPAPSKDEESTLDEDESEL
jgi:hypothetical protein